ncbi:uncharacterized protein ACLA_057470 [Aspergillus clavatus NRRL 1]|uniref:Uncharacterized protein n=1 Tax=Aspergillus clavatus (strain ATCC 1007 / CBS 513.65 / DSM 816 / NCTC 3887 / NRRL 1 / QM 1276 / 107) TaxID=344612 RepID=A1C3V1_ASPCL|nr:uncharacterized protein ACLA_057470 [Aspergillus clavatus NRRL 1]EAW15091.1 hypothetical protein ACLA_057470 [Aspergillus clavatus NRRL 1]
MAYSGLPRQRSARRRAETSERKSHLYCARRRERHLANGPTLPQYAPNTNISAASLRGKWNRFCLEAALDPDELLRNLTAADVKAWFDWIKDNFRDMDPDMRRDCLNYKNQVSKEMGLRKLPLPKPTADSIDLLEFQVTHLVHCDSVFADEKQRLYPLVGLNLSSISACRAVSLFDTRHLVNPRPDGTFGMPGEEIVTEEEHDLSSADSLSDGFSSDSGYDTGISSGLGEMEELTSEMDDDEFDLDHEDNDGYTSDGSTVTDDGYLAGNEETGTILWRHVEFYIIRNPVHGCRNLLAAIVTLLHTKGEDRKPRIGLLLSTRTTFDLLSQLLALGIDDDIFVATIRDVADIYTVPLPRHRRGILLKIKRDMLDLPIFREPERTDEGYRTSVLLALRARAWARYIKKIGRKTGQEENLTQKEVRRGAINAINNRAPASVRDQVAEHESNAVKYYLNEKVDFDTAAAFHRRASNEVVQREMRTATLVAVRRLRARCQQLTLMIHQLGFTVKEAQHDELGLSLDEEEDTEAKELCEEALEIGRQKKEADAMLNQTLTKLRESALGKNRKRHFRNTDTEIFNRQYEAQLCDEEVNNGTYSQIATSSQNEKR